MHNDYYIKVAKRYGPLGLRSLHIDTFSGHEAAISAIMHLEAGTYTLKTYWDEELFDKDDFSTDGAGNVFKNTADGILKITSYFDYANYVYTRAFICNEFMQDERLKEEKK